MRVVVCVIVSKGLKTAAHTKAWGTGRMTGLWFGSSPFSPQGGQNTIEFKLSVSAFMKTSNCFDTLTSGDGFRRMLISSRPRRR